MHSFQTVRNPTKPPHCKKVVIGFAEITSIPISITEPRMHHVTGMQNTDGKIWGF